MKKQIRIIIMLLAISFLFCSCEKKNVTCEELLGVGLEYGIDGYSKNGYIFLSGDDSSSIFYMSEKMKEEIYGKKFISCLNSTKDFAIYISASSPIRTARS